MSAVFKAAIQNISNEPNTLGFGSGRICWMRSGACAVRFHQMVVSVARSLLAFVSAGCVLEVMESIR